jgi:hypothetical protein
MRKFRGYEFPAPYTAAVVITIEVSVELHTAIIKNSVLFQTKFLYSVHCTSQ